MTQWVTQKDFDDIVSRVDKSMENIEAILDRILINRRINQPSYDYIMHEKEDE